MRARKRLRAALWIAAVVTIVLALVITVVLYASLPQIAGTRSIEGLRGDVTVSRDSIGHTTIHAQNRLDLARVSGFVHAQERFLSMDVRRRLAAGELAALFGPFLVERDREARPHRFRDRARQIVASLPEDERAILLAYTEGVNQGLESLPVWPFPYSLFLTRPKRWEMEDSILTLFSMHLILQGGRWKYESVVGVLAEAFGVQVANFLAPVGTHFDAPLDDTPIPLYTSRLPDAQKIDLRSIPLNPEQLDDVRMPWERAGSNAFAVGGNLTSHGGSLVANDMHLVLLVPNIWYRIHWQWANDGENRLASGLTLPGLPWLIAGSNGHVAWGFTNSNADSQDLVVLDPAESNPVEVKETLEVRFGADEELVYHDSLWGPVVSEDSQGRLRALRWASHWLTGERINFSQIELAKDLPAAIALFQQSAIPPQNVLLADRHGSIGWTIAGALFQREGYSGRIPINSSKLESRVPKWLSSTEYPLILNPPDRRLWSANSRSVGGREFALLGDGRYTTGIRARQIRDRLREKDIFRESDLLEVQLDLKARYLDEWRHRLKRVLREPGFESLFEHHKVRKWVDQWDGYAHADSVGYRIVRNFRKRVHELFLLALQTRLGLEPDRHTRHLRWQLDGPLTRILDGKEDARHFLPQNMRSWDEFLALALKLTIEELIAEDQDLAKATWGAQNYARIYHPLSVLLPFLGPFLDTPPTPLSGDLNLPRVAHRSFGASQRMVVSPSREENGIMHMPAGQSGHPLSPFYLAGHEDWLEGRATPFLPGPAAATMKFTPSEY